LLEIFAGRHGNEAKVRAKARAMTDPTLSPIDGMRDIPPDVYRPP